MFIWSDPSVSSHVENSSVSIDVFDSYITVKCFIYYVDFNLHPWYYNFYWDSNPPPLSLQRESEKSFSLKTLKLYEIKTKTIHLFFKNLLFFFLKRVFKSPWAITKIPRYFSWNACSKCGVTLHCRHGIIYKRTFLSCIFWTYLSFTKNCLLGVHEDTLKILACLHWFSQKGKES